MELFFSKLYKIISRITLIVFILLSLSVIILAPIIYVVTPEKILENYTKSYLIENNVENINFKISRFDTNKLIINDINFNDKEKISIDSISINYDISKLPKINVNYIKLDKININGQADNKGILSFGNIEEIITNISSTDSSDSKVKESKGDDSDGDGDGDDDRKEKKENSISGNSILTFIEDNLKINQIIITDSFVNLSSDSNKASIPLALKANIHKDAKITNLYDDMSVDLVLYDAKFNLQDFNIPSTGYVTTDISIRGEVPIEFKVKKPIITDGILKSYEEGKIIFTSSIPNGNPSMDTLIKSLSNYNYKTISVDLNSDESGDLTLGLSIDGNNNDMYGKRNIELNVNLSVNIFKTIKSFLDVYSISEGLENRFLSE